MNPEQHFPFKEDEEGIHLVLRTTEGVFELRPYDTYIFEPENIALGGLSHVYHITGDNEEEDKYEGFYMWRSQFEKTGHDFDVFVQELKDNGYETIEFEMPHPDDLRAYEQAHGEPFKQPPEISQYSQSTAMEKVIEEALTDFDAKAYWYIGEWGEEYGSQH